MLIRLVAVTWLDASNQRRERSERWQACGWGPMRSRGWGPANNQEMQTASAT